MKKLFVPPVFLLISFLLVVTFYFITPGFNWVPIPFNFIGIIIALTGFFIMGKSRGLFKKHNTTLTIENSSHMITDGIFSITRNPMYLGMFLLLLGIGICFMNLFSILTSIGFILFIRIIFISKEEKLMYDTFGQGYLDYKMKVRRWI